MFKRYRKNKSLTSEMEEIGVGCIPKKKGLPYAELVKERDEKLKKEKAETEDNQQKNIMKEKNGLHVEQKINDIISDVKKLNNNFDITPLRNNVKTENGGGNKDRVGNKKMDISAVWAEAENIKTGRDEKIKDMIVLMGMETGWDTAKIVETMQKQGCPADIVKEIIRNIPSEYKLRDIEEKIKKEKQKQIEEQQKQRESRKIIGADGRIIPTWTEKESVHWKGWDMFLYTWREVRAIDALVRIRQKMGEEKKGLRIYRLFNKGDHYDNYGKKEFDIMYKILDWQPHPDLEKAKEGKTKYDLYLEVPRHPRSRFYYTQPMKKTFPELIQENIMGGKIILGEGIDIHDKRTPITLPIHDLYTHTLITGGTGKGKTTLLVHQALQLIAAGVNLFVFDPKGELIDGILPHLPESLLHQNRVVIIDPYDTELPVSINPLYLPGLEELKQMGDKDKIDDLQGRLKENIVDMLKRITPVEGGSPSLDKNMRGIIGACLDAGKTTLIDAFYIIDDKTKRWRLLNMLGKEENKHYLTSLLNDIKYGDDLLSTINRLHPFFDTTILKRMVCKRTNPLDFSSLVEPGKIVLIDLRKSKVSASVGKILGTIYLIQLWISIMGKKGAPDVIRGREHGRFPTIAIMDEFQNFTTQSFVDVLNEARSYNFGLILATQYLSQISQEMRVGLIENVALHIALGVGAEDAKILKDVLGCKEKYLMRLDPFTFYGRAKVGAITTKAFYGELYNPLRRPHNWELFVKLFYERSREIYGRPYNAMDTSLFGTDVRQIEDMLKAVHCLQIKNRGKNSFFFDEVKSEMERIATMPELLRVGAMVSISKSCADQGLMKNDFDEKKASDLPKNERFRAFKYSITQDGLAKIGVDTKAMGRSAAAGGPAHKDLVGAARDLTLLLGGDMIIKNQDEGGTEYLPDAEVHVEPVMDGRTPSQQEKIRKMLESKPIYSLSGGRDINWEVESSTVGVREKIIHNFCKGLRENRIVFFGVASEQDGYRVAGIMDDFVKEGYKKYKKNEAKTYDRNAIPRDPTPADYQIFVLSDPSKVYDMRTGLFRKVKTTTGIGMDMLTFGYSKTLLPILEKIVQEKKSMPLTGDVSEEEKQKILNGPWDIPLQNVHQGLEEYGLATTMSKQDVLNTMKKLGVATLDAPSGHIENTLFTFTQENLEGIKVTLEEEEEETVIKETEMRDEYNDFIKAKNVIEKQINQEGRGIVEYFDEDDMSRKVNMGKTLLHRFLAYEGATKTEDGKIRVTNESLSKIVEKYQKTMTKAEVGKEPSMMKKPDITFHQLLGFYNKYANTKKIDKSGIIKYNIGDFLVEMGVREQYNIPSDTMKKFTGLLQKHVKEVGGMNIIKSSVMDEIKKTLEESGTLKKLGSLCDYIKKEKGIMESGIAWVQKAEINALLGDFTETAWRILQEEPVCGAFDEETGCVVLTLEQLQEFEKQLPDIAQKYQKYVSSEVRKMKYQVLPMGRKTQTGIYANLKAEDGTEIGPVWVPTELIGPEGVVCELKKEKSCGAVILREEEGKERMFLLLQYKPESSNKTPWWDFVKGHMESGEEEKDTVIREIKEETGLGKENIKFSSDFRATISYYHFSNGFLMYKEVAYYLVKAVTEKIQINSVEHLDYVWLPYEETLKKATYKNSKEILKKAVEVIVVVSAESKKGVEAVAGITPGESKAAETEKTNPPETGKAVVIDKNRVYTKLPAKCYFCGKELTVEKDCTLTNEYGYVCLRCYDEKETIGPGAVAVVSKPDETKDDVEKKKTGGRPKKQIDVEKIIQMKKDGKSVREIAKETGVSVGLVSNILKEYVESK